MGDGDIRPPTESTPLNRSPKNLSGNFVGDPYSCAKFSAHPSTGGFWANGWNITRIIFYLFMTLFSGTHLQVRRVDGSNDAISRVWLENAYSRPQNCFFWGILPPKCGEISTKPPKRYIPVRVRVVWAIKRENPSTRLTCRWVPEKRVINK